MYLKQLWKLLKNKYSLNIVIDYIKYLIKARGRQGIHSPFVYSLVNNCLSIKLKDEDVKTIKKWDELIKKDKDRIQVNDLGAGSKKLNNNRKVAEIYKISSSKKKYGKLLYQLSKYYKPNNVLELGTSLGTGTIFMHLGNKNAEITTVEGCPNTANKAKFYWNGILKTNKIKVEINNFTTAIENLKDQFDFIFIDGNHKRTAVMEMLKSLKSNIHDETIIIIDDIRWNTDMKNLWLNLVDLPEYHLTLDFFRMGIIMKRPHQRKEHFIIRY